MAGDENILDQRSIIEVSPCISLRFYQYGSQISLKRCQNARMVDWEPICLPFQEIITRRLLVRFQKVLVFLICTLRGVDFWGVDFWRGRLLGVDFWGSTFEGISSFWRQCRAPLRAQCGSLMGCHSVMRSRIDLRFFLNEKYSLALSVLRVFRGVR